MLLAPALLAVALLVLVGGVMPTFGQTAMPAEEFLGPYSSWNQVQCGGSDDTTMLQNALNALGNTGTSPVLYIKPGTCRITGTLTLSGKDSVTVLGADPATTKIVWGGPAGTDMIKLIGVAHSRFGRLTWDHGGVGGLIYDGAWPGGACCFPTGNRHEDEWYQGMVDQPGSAAYLGGSAGQGDAETTWIRNRFIGPSQVGIYLNNYNVLDYWVWDSLFQNMDYGVANATATGAGAGGFAVNRSTFLGSTQADMQISNTNYFGARWNYSKASTQFIGGGPQGKSPAPWTVQGNTVLDTPSTSNIIDMGNPGPLVLLDNTFRATTSNIKVGDPYANQNMDGELISVGNTYTKNPPFDSGSATRVRSVDDTIAASVTDPGQPATPATPQNQNRQVFEPATRDSAGIQNAVNQAVAAGTRAVVHLPYGGYTITQTIEVPANATIQITGDGQGQTSLGASGATGSLIHFAGPTKAIIRDLTLYGNDQVQGMSLTGVNQTNGVIHTEDLLGAQNAVGVLVDGVNQTAVDLLDNMTSATSAADVRLRNGAKAVIFNGSGSGSTGTGYDVQGNSSLVVETMYFENPAAVQFVAPNGNGTLILDNGKLQAAAGSATDLSTFTGLSTVQGIDIYDNGTLTGGANTLSLGVIAGAGAQSNTSSPYAIWSPRTDTGGGGSAPAAESSAGITDPASFLRQHEAAVRAAKPKQLGDNGAGVTDFHVYRVSGTRLTAVMSAQGTPGAAAPAPTATPTTPPTVAPTATPVATTAPVTNPPTTAPGANPTGGTSFVSSITRHGGLRNDYGDLVGMQISVGASPLTITDLGRFVETGNNGTHALSIYRASDGTQVASTTLNLATAAKDSTGYAYAGLSSPVTLTANTKYYIVSSETVGGDTWEGTSQNFPTLAHSTAATVVGPIFRMNGSWNVGDTGADESYGPVSFRTQSSTSGSGSTTGSTTTTTTPFVSQITRHGGVRNDYGDLVGMQISVGAAPMTITDLGRYVATGNSGTHTLSVFRASDGTQVATSTLNLATATKDSTGFAYAALSSPATLTANTKYYVVSSETIGGDTWEGTSQNFPTLAHSTAATVVGPIFRMNGTWNVGDTGADESYGPLSFRTSTSSSTTTALSTASPFVSAITRHGGIRNDYGDLVGMQISVGASPLTVSDLGRYVETGNSGSHTLSIFRVSDGAQVASTTVNLATAAKDSTGYAYAALSSPVTLTANTSYYIVSGETVGGDTWEGTYQNFPTLTHSTVATVVGPVYRMSGKWNLGDTKADESYGPVSFRTVL